MQDSDIIALYDARDERAIQETQNMYAHFCQALAMSILDNRMDSEECVNDTWLTLWNSIPPTHPASLKAYAGRITRNLALSRWRYSQRRKRHAGLSVPLEELAECLPDTLEPQGLTELLEAFLETLSTTERKLFMGRYWHNYSRQQLADAYGLTPNAVGLRLMRTREKLRTHLESHGYHI